MSMIHKMLPQVRRYINETDWQNVPALRGKSFSVAPLAQGEYNLNYFLAAPDRKLVFRLNVGTQINRDDQILYEYRALKLLADSGVTPTPYYVDDSRSFFQRGILIMEYLPGEPLDYRRDLDHAARLFAVTRGVPVSEDQNHLIREDFPLTLIFEECDGLLQHYFEADLADPDIRDYLMTVREWAREARRRERYYREDPCNCILNTEVNSRNFIVNRQKDTTHLVDWEMPRWGDPSQDLCHFCSPLTTLWKTRCRMTGTDKADFLHTYKAGISDPHLRDTLEERVRLRDPFVYLRGISWSAMGWVAYQTRFDGVRNPDTWATLQRYMNLDFIRSLFDPFLRA
jgi:hypothetical protein